TALVQSQNFVPNVLIVKFRSDAPDSVLDQVFTNKDFSAVVSRSYTPSIKKISSFSAAKKSTPYAVSAPSPSSRLLNASRIAHVRFADDETSRRALAELQQSPFIEYAQRNYIHKIDQLPNDSAASSQWD